MKKPPPCAEAENGDTGQRSPQWTGMQSDLSSNSAVNPLTMLIEPLLPVSTQVEEYADEVFDLLDNGAHIYFCGLKGMMPGIQDMLERVSGEKG